ncbi:hypothetical protein KAJ27_03475 [bacterium]|nr:hypothetical protein [bacterium]
MNDFRNNLWNPLRLLSQGKSLYNINELFPGKQAVWLPMALGLFFPLGFLPLKIACSIWFSLNLSILITMFIIYSQYREINRTSKLLSAFVIFLYPFAIKSLFMGQITIIIAAIWFFIAHYFSKLPTFFVSILIVISLTKPQLAILVFPIVFYHQLSGIGKPPLWKLLMTYLAGFTILLLPLFIFHAEWIPDFITALKNNPKWLHPSTFQVLKKNLGNSAYILNILLYIFALFSVFKIYMSKGLRAAILIGLALTPLVTPYLWSYDFIIILPLFIHILCTSDSIKIKVVHLLVFTLISVWIYYKSANIIKFSDYNYWWTSWGLCTVSLIFYFKKIKYNHQR